MVSIERYNESYKELWDAHIAPSKNGTFLFYRDYMDYHADRFTDYSLLLFLDDGTLMAVLPANVRNNKIYTHQGLTYGGLILREKVSLTQVLEGFSAIFAHLADNSISEMVYKPVPTFMHKILAQEEMFVLGLVNATLQKVDTSFVIDYSKPIDFQTRRMRSVKKGRKAGVTVRVSSSFNDYWTQVLSPNLKEKYGSQPVHSLQEIELLHSRFPDNIVQCDALLNGEIVAGATVYVTDAVAHTQYISSIDAGREIGALDFLFHEMITRIFADKRYFSFGTANNDGNDLNKGVAEWKAGWGAEIYPNFVFTFNTQATEHLNRILQ